jgi:hypothetical protein
VGGIKSYREMISHLSTSYNGIRGGPPRVEDPLPLRPEGELRDCHTQRPISLYYHKTFQGRHSQKLLNVIDLLT